MKKILSLIVFTSLFFAGCSSDGDVGPQGPPGEDGAYIVGQAFEATVDFTDPDYSIYAEFPSEIEVFSTDVVLVYWNEALPGEDPFWNLLPQTFYTDSGQWQYNYNYTDIDVNIYIQSEFEDKSLIEDRYLNDQTFKVVILPVDDYQNAKINFENFYEVKKYLN